MHLPLNTVKPTSLQQLTPSLLKHCKLIIQANLIHQQTLIQGITSQFTIHLISTYLAVNAPAHALSLLRRLPPSPSAVFWWNALIRRNIQLGRQRRSLELFVTMKRLGWYPDEYTFPFVFKACGEIVPTERRVGGSVHCVVLASGFESNVFVCNGLVAMYGRLGDLANARKVFDEMCERNVFDLVSWNSVVAACLQNGDSVNAIGLFRRMFNGGGVDGEFSLLQADAVSLVNILPACASIRAGLTGKEVHGFAVRTGLCEDLFVANALVDMYCKCNMMDSAERVFERMDEKDLVSWNAMVTGYSQAGRFEDALRLFEKMKEDNIELDVVSWSAFIAGYAQRGLGYEAMDVFRQMQVSGTKPNEITLVSLLSGCASVGALLHGKETHCYAMKQKFNFGDGDSEDGLMVLNALIDMYAKCKRVDVARAMFDSIALVDRTVVSWTVIIGGYAQHGQANEALELFSWMLKLGRTVKPNAFTISCALVACARLSALRFGRQIHAYVLRQHHSETIFVLNCLLDMYAKSGDINAARTVFDNVKERNDITWTSLMAGYGVHGCGKEALDIFEEMRKAGIRPDSVISLVVLYACSHSGMINEGIKYFHDMTQQYGFIPGLEHYACMVDLLGRAGRLDEAMKLIEEMPMKPCPIVWVALLSGCRKHGNVELGEYAANRLLELECQYDGSYTLLSNIYANASRWKDVAKVRTLMKQTKIRKRPGCSWVQAKKGTVTFYVGDRTHPETKQIYEILSDMIQQIKVLGYVPETSFALHDVDDEEKDDLLFEHSEKLALAYGILTTSPGTPIRITKNLRICGDCHSAITYISMIIDHEIILRDSSRFHHFKNGSCSCKGYW